MDRDNTKLVLQLVAKLPLMARVALLHLLHMSPPSKYVDLRTELTVAVLRSFLEPSTPMSITGTQNLLNRDPGIKGRIWIAKYTAPAPPEPSIRDIVIRTVESMRPAATAAAADHDDDKSQPSPPPQPLTGVQWPDVVPVEAEWTGYRASATASSRLPLITEAEKYGEMMKEVTSPVTVLYFHGGAYYLMDPATHRPTTKKIAKLTGGRCYSVRYRLAPQNPFPAALIDALQSYLALLFPPPGALHDPVRSEDIVFAGDSAGGNLCMALIQLLLDVRRRGNVEIQWHGQQIHTVPLPAGIALSSPWLDMTHSSASCKTNTPFDYLPMLEELDKIPRPSCPAWPAQPPRKMLYCDDALITHPLVTLLTAPSWEGCPPVFMSTGWELLADEDKYMAAHLHSQGVPVVWEEYEGMPHCFAMVLTDHPMSRMCFEAWARFMKEAVESPTNEKKSVFRTIRAKTMKDEERDPAQLAPYTERDLQDRLRELAAQWTGPKATGDVAARL
ncbi:acetyl-hydrolase-like protein [Cryphonectria parasitica EP155]|uniref:Acetyl-hydrolase-like protein n=1 Tax=Cryphonectria parasitica (strain ATCC 38755 / EP155) TaxID=660469 RepID=A0A9P5CKU6_CRYP1|nr:acetyl-hydrolase-like protein [Cryphonectria parasitica EP155]KAF3761331.1 acetyl-hydrolase-like protein [Cryphonectria parasitica EP155]